MHRQVIQPQENNFDVGSMADEDAKDDIDVCMKEASSKREYTLYTDQDNARFFKLTFVKVMSASAAAKQLGIHVYTAQRWAQMYKTDPHSIFIKYKKTGRSCILHEEHKQVILEYIGENPSATLEQVSKNTVYNFVRTECNLSLKKAQFQPVYRSICKWECTDMDFRTNRVFLDKSAFHINLKRSMAWSKKGLPAVVTVPKTRAQTTTILGAISASGLIKYSLRLPQPPAKKRKREGYVELTSTGTVTGHYFSFLKVTMDEMDQYPHIKWYYLVMDRAIRLQSPGF
ncbi:hypothetical protein BCV72DRAFT_330256 [Rhizopus microsporus var. microsporus]|uniref:Homeodomain-like DNA binding domain-containing transcription factor n=1 Tax=Rhizopus microsporus var. microsporus TaxID=86635 RepID=A0A1X0R147_RHIZD|nr:hypothetical protein BCV72DRAFT_330256 [Rhizopus microsporus var. microsporus]